MLRSVQQPATEILLIEDRPSDAELIRTCLEDIEADDFHVTHVGDMASAIPHLTARNLKAVVLDLFLPDTNELEGLANIQAMAPNLPVIILTGRDDENLAFKAVEGGAQDYLLKERINGKTLRRSIRYAIHRKRFEDAVIHQALFDQLTGLANRDLFKERLRVACTRQRRSGKTIGLMLMDLNGFKSINDTFGHEAGDALLKEIGQRVPQCLRPYDLAARFGGDEFVILIEDVPQEQDCASVAQKIIDTITRPMVLGSRTLAVGVSIGIAFCRGGDDVTPELLMRQADEAMYRAKKSRVNTYQFHNNPVATTEGLFSPPPTWKSKVRKA